MTLTISLPAETEAKLRMGAAANGLSADAYARQLIERGLQGGAEGSLTSQPSQKTKTWEEIVAPFQQEVAASGMTDDDVRDFFTEVRDEVRAEKRGPRLQG